MRRAENRTLSFEQYAAQPTAKKKPAHRADSFLVDHTANCLSFLSEGKEVDAVRRWVAQRLEQPRRHQNRHIMRLAIEHPGRLFRRQTRRKLPEQ